MKKTIKFITMILALAISVSHILPVYADTSDLPDNGNGEPVELELEELDPSTLHIHKLGEVEQQEEPEEEITFDFNRDDVVRVSIVLDKPSTIDAGYSTENIAKNRSAVSYRDSLIEQQAAMTKTIERKLNRPLDVKWNLTLAANIISANVRYGDINKIRMISGVKRVFLENRYEAMDDSVSDPLTANTSTGMVGATAAWAAGYTGAGSRIAIIDTGLDTTHQSVNADAFNYAINQLENKPTLMTAADYSNLDLNGQGRYISAKIPYAYNYVDKNQKITHLDDTEGEHGSHVAGIAAANRFIKQGNSYVDAASTVHAVGMAPDAQILVMKVFGAAGGAYDSDYFAALEDAITLGCDSANLSLGGGSPGFTFGNTYQEMLNKLSTNANNKMVVVISAGNSYALTQYLETDLYIDDVSLHTGGSPGTYINSLGVAAAQNIGATGAPLKFNGKDIYYTDTGKTAMTSITGSYSFVYIDALGEADDYSAVNSAVSLNDKIVIVNRGSNTFVDKANNSISYKPKALIIANNQPGAISMDLDDFTGSFPVVSITLADAENIKNNSTKKTTGNYTYYTGTITVTSSVVNGQITAREDAEMTDFSSWGVPGSLIMKPEITAPGGDIYSIFGTNKTTSGSTTGGSDQYELMSGTSMAAPHVTGLAAVVAQYLRENKIADSNEALNEKYSTRAVTQSLLMSTATPMKNNGNYVSVLQQGSGLAEVSKAVTASSVIMINENDDTLTARTGSAADGKVKVEFGDDPAKTGSYSYSFTIYNLSNTDLEYRLSTDIFTQDRYSDEGEWFMDYTTTPLNSSVNYIWQQMGEVSGPQHDVNKDGQTDQQDARALAEHLAGNIDGSSLDLSAGDMDEDDTISSRDIHLLLNWQPEGGSVPANTVPAHGSRMVTVEISVSDSKLNNYPSGAYIEGFTKVECITSDSEGKSYQHTHTIPLLGFYGNWTDPSMFDNTSYVDTVYGTEKIPYTGNTNTNYIELTYNGVNTKFTGNPYMVEDAFPSDKLAINSYSTINKIVYNLIRSAGTTGFAVSKISDYDGEVTDVVENRVIGNEVEGIWYYESQGSWQNTGIKFIQSNFKPSDKGLKEGEMFRIGFYAVPEYNAMKVNNDYSSANAGILSSARFETLLMKNELGRGAFVGYDFLIDNTDPIITKAVLSGSNLTVTASDNYKLAYVAVLSLDGEVKYAEKAPGTSEYSITFDASEAIANAHGYVAVFAGDYAGNETAKAVKVNDNNYEERTVYVLTDTLTAEEDYLIVNRNTVGNGVALGHTNTTPNTSSVTVRAANSTVGSPYIDSTDAAATSIFTVSEGWYFKNGNYYAARSTSNRLTFATSTGRAQWSWNSSSHQLTNNSRYLGYSGSSFTLGTSAASVYLYKKTVIRMEVDPYNVTSIKMTPESLDLYKGNETDLVARVLPLTAEDRTVSWSSSNNSVATVNRNGHVVAVGSGNATITATSNSNNAVTASCSVRVTVVNKNLNGIVWDEEGKVYFSGFNTSSLPTWNKLHDSSREKDLHSAFQNTASALYAGTLDAGSAETILYSVNSSSYALTELGTNYVVAVDATRGPSSSSFNNYYVYGFANYLVIGNLSPETDDELGTYSGFPYGLLDISETSGDAYICGVAAKTISTTSGTYYYLDESGKIWQTNLTYSSRTGLTFSTPTQVIDTGISTSFLYQSLYYDGTYIYWTHCDGSQTELIIINPGTGALYHAGDFGKDVWPVAGLFVRGSAAPASAGDEPMDIEEPLELNLTKQMTREEMMTDEVLSRFHAEAEKMERAITVSVSDVAEMEEVAETEEAVNEVTGSTEAYRIPANLVIKKVNGVSVTESGTAVITLSEDSASENGIFEITYDTEVLSNPTVTVGSAAEIVSFNINEETGTIKIVYGARNSIKANTAIATVRFEVPCDDGQVTVVTSQRNTQLALNESSTVTVKGTGHDWETVTYEWSADNTKVTASRICANDPGHIETETVSTTSRVTKQATCETAGETTYTAVFTNPAFENQNSVVANINPTGHKWNFTSFNWTGNESAVAEYTCFNDSRHKTTANAKVTVERQKDPLCDVNGLDRYTAEISAENSPDKQSHQEHKDVTLPMLGHDVSYHAEIPATCTQDGMMAHYTCSRCGTSFLDEVCSQPVMTTELIIKATGHSWGEPVWSWDNDFMHATATFTCRNDASHQESIRSAEAVIEETSPTHQTDGKRTYTVSVTGPDGKTYQDEKEITLPALGYDFEFTEFRWSDDYSKADAVYTDKESGKTRFITVNSTEVTVASTCTEDGSVTYTVFISATESYDGKQHSETKMVTLSAIGHNWGEITYSWSEDNSQATASVHCLNDNAHQITETVKTSSEVTRKPTCTEMGETTYTAAFTNKMFMSQQKKLDNIPTTGHKEGDKVIENKVEPTCIKEGSYDIVIYCSECGEQLSRETVRVEPTGHKADEKHRENEVAATCTSAGSYDEVVRCTVCNEVISSEHFVIAALGHHWNSWTVTKAATCTEKGLEERECSRCHEKETREINALGHDYGEWIYDGAQVGTHTRVCGNDPTHKETEKCQYDEGVTVGNTTTYTCAICHGQYSVTASEEPVIEGIVRVAGDNRYKTAESITDFIMEAKAEEKLDAIVLACGGKFADALSGSYLAAVNECPIMLIDDKSAAEIEAYLKTVMNPDGKVYILGGTSAISSEIEKEVRKSVKNVVRLAGDNRYGTNLEILKDSDLTSEVILVATGKDFADSLSASATGLPLLLVKDALDDVQKSYLKDIRGRKFIILGGEKAVSSDIENQLKTYGSVERIAGANRFETSVRIAEKLFEAPKCAVLAFSNDFPDGLCGGPLAQMLKAPVILTRSDKASIAREYLQSQGITDGVVLGGTARIDDDTVRKLYGLSSSSPIELYQK